MNAVRLILRGGAVLDVGTAPGGRLYLAVNGTDISEAVVSFEHQMSGNGGSTLLLELAANVASERYDEPPMAESESESTSEPDVTALRAEVAATAEELDKL